MIALTLFWYSLYAAYFEAVMLSVNIVDPTKSMDKSRAPEIPLEGVPVPGRSGAPVAKAMSHRAHQKPSSPK